MKTVSHIRVTRRPQHWCTSKIKTLSSRHPNSSNGTFLSVVVLNRIGPTSSCSLATLPGKFVRSMPVNTCQEGISSVNNNRLTELGGTSGCSISSCETLLVFPLYMKKYRTQKVRTLTRERDRNINK